MNTFQLVCFLTAAEHLNFTKAAEVPHVTQPAVGQQIHSLENELGVKLFTRTTRSVKLTREGKRFISDANQIVSISERAKKHFASTSTDEIEHLAIGCESFPFMYQMIGVLENLKEKRPGIHPELQICRSGFFDFRPSMRFINTASWRLTLTSFLPERRRRNLPMPSGEKARSAGSNSLCAITGWNSVGMIIWRRRTGSLRSAGVMKKAWSTWNEKV